MKTEKKYLLLCALIITFLGFLYLVLADNASISVPVFALIQAVLFYLLTKNKEIFYLFIPIFLLSLSFFTSANWLWRLPTIIVIAILYSFIALLLNNRLDFKISLFGFIKRTLFQMFSVLNYVTLPFSWFAEIFAKRSTTARKIIIALIISVPVLFVLISMLTQIDLIFSGLVDKTFGWLIDALNAFSIIKVNISILTSFYIFGILYSIVNPEVKYKPDIQLFNIKADMLMINIVLGLTLVVYTIFIFIQFKYLFAKGSLPFDLNYAEYARRGFFELLFLTAVNLGVIVFATYQRIHADNKNCLVNTIMLNYLCTITIVLLTSSFYRMMLYSDDFGLTRLRLYVFGFLVFELIGLIITYFYINKPKFNIIAVYTGLSLIYFILLVLIPTDRIIARNQIDRFMQGKELEIEYVVSLSLDAAPEIARLTCHPTYTEAVYQYFINHYDYYDKSWRAYNLSAQQAKKIYQELKCRGEKNDQSS